jgi:hypothetical protein
LFRHPSRFPAREKQDLCHPVLTFARPTGSSLSAFRWMHETDSAWYPSEDNSVPRRSRTGSSRRQAVRRLRLSPQLALLAIDVPQLRWGVVAAVCADGRHVARNDPLLSGRLTSPVSCDEMSSLITEPSESHGKFERSENARDLRNDRRRWSAELWSSLCGHNRPPPARR